MHVRRTLGNAKSGVTSKSSASALGKPFSRKEIPDCLTEILFSSAQLTPRTERASYDEGFENATFTLHGIQVFSYLITVHEVKDTSRQEPTRFTESIRASTDMDIMETEFTLSP